MRLGWIRPRQRTLTRMTLLALLAALLLPTLARAGGATLAASPGAAAWAEVCTSEGLRRVAVPGDGPAAPLAAAFDGHCAACARADAAPPPAVDAPAVPRAAVSMPGPCAAAPDAGAVPRWPLPPPRAPPAAPQP